MALCLLPISAALPVIVSSPAFLIRLVMVLFLALAVFSFDYSLSVGARSSLVKKGEVKNLLNLRPAVGVFVQHHRYQLPSFSRNIVRELHLLFEDVFVRVVLVLPSEGGDAATKVVGQDPETPDVHVVVVAALRDNFGRDVVRRSAESVPFSFVTHSQAEIRYFQ